MKEGSMRMDGEAQVAAVRTESYVVGVPRL